MKKKQAVFTIICCSVAVLILLGVLAVGLQSDGFGLGALRRGDVAEAAENGAYSYVDTWDPEETAVSGLDVEWVNGTVEIKPSKEKVIRIKETSDRALADNERLRLSFSGGVLKIKWENKIINFSLFQNRYKSLTIQVPEEVAGSLKSLKCATASGDIRVSGFTAAKQEFSSASGSLELSGLSGEEGEFSTTSGDVGLAGGDFSKELEASTTSGKVELSGVKTEEVTLNTVSGDVSYTGAAGKADANSVSGAVRYELDSCPEEGDFDSVSGPLILTIPENGGFRADYSSISGKFSSDFPVTGGSGKSGQAVYSSGKARLSFSTTSGDMEVRKK